MKLKYPIPEDFLKEETRNGYLVTAEIKKVWAVQIDLLQELLRVCQAHGLKIYADGGTLLGAIRHKGYIPWDDDIDMMMLREDYDKLMKLADEFQHPYFLQSVATDPHYGHRHAQLRNSDTACWPYNQKGCNRKHNQGIFIDVFPADNIPNNPRAFSRYYKRLGVVRQKFRLVQKLTNVLPEPIYHFCRNKTRFLSDKKRYQDYENVLRSVPFNPLGNVCEISFRHSMSLIPVSYFGEPQWVDFEFFKMPIPTEYHLFLIGAIGPDYMTPKQVSSEHGSLNFDTERSYKNVK